MRLKESHTQQWKIVMPDLSVLIHVAVITKMNRKVLINIFLKSRSKMQYFAGSYGNYIIMQTFFWYIFCNILIETFYPQFQFFLTVAEMIKLIVNLSHFLVDCYRKHNNIPFWI